MKLIFIEKGEIDFYTAFSIETKLSYEVLCNKLDDYIKNIIDTYQQNCEKILHKTIGEKYSEEIENLTTNQIYEDIREESDDVPKVIMGKNSKIFIGPGQLENSIRLQVIPEALDILNNQHEQYKSDYNFAKRIYGERYVNAQMRFALPPFEIELNNTCICINAELIIFENLMGVLRISLPLNNVDSIPLKKYSYDDYIDTITNIFNLDAFEDNGSISDIEKAYCDILLKIKGVKSLSNISRITNISLADYKGIPNGFDNLNKDLQEEFYKIICAPANDIAGLSYRKDACNYIESHSFGDYSIKYIVSTMGRCLAVANKKVIEHQKNNVKEQIQTDEWCEACDNKVREDILYSMRLNVEYVLIILLLKKVNIKQSQFNKVLSSDFSKARSKYNSNTLFILQLLDGCYGTVRDQLKQFEKMMTYFSDEDINKETLMLIDKFFEEKESQRKEYLQDFLGIGALLLAAIVGLPSIYDTVTLIRSICDFKKDIPFLTVENVSVGTWLFLLLFICFFVFKNSRIKTKLLKLVKKTKFYISLYLSKKDK